MKPLAWLSALLPLAGIALFYLLPAGDVQEFKAKQPPTTTLRSGGFKRQPEALDFTNSNSKSKKIKLDADTEQVIARLTKAEEGIARLAARITPEQQEKDLDKLMRFWKPNYLSLFAVWNLDAATVNDTLTIIRENKIKLMELDRRFFLGGSSFTPEYKKMRLILDDKTEKQLSQRLGRKRYEELTAMEKSRELAPSD